MPVSGAAGNSSTTRAAKPCSPSASAARSTRPAPWATTATVQPSLSLSPTYSMAPSARPWKLGTVVASMRM